MGNCFLHGNGGYQLDFKVVAYATEEELLAAIPKENTIGVETDSFNGYVFDATEPENPSDRMLWIQVSEASPCKFPVTKDKTININPVKCWQYVDGAWKVIVSYLYKDAKWSVFGRLYLYRNKKLNKSVVQAFGNAHCGYSSLEATGFPQKDSEYGFEMVVTTDFYGTDAKLGNLFAFYTEPLKLLFWKLTHFKTLTFTGLFDSEPGNASSGAIFGCWSSISDGYKNNIRASKNLTETTTEPIVVDVSTLDTGNCYIGIGVRCGRARMDECYLEM